MSRTALLLVALASVVAPIGANAQSSSPLIGTWNVELESGRRMDNDVVTPIMAKATIAITTSGDSLLATVTIVSRTDGSKPAPPATFGGKKTATGAVFTQVQQSRINMNGEESVREVKVTWTLNAEGNTLTGNLVRDIPGIEIMAAPAPIKGTRATL